MWEHGDTHMVTPFEGEFVSIFDRDALWNRWTAWAFNISGNRMTSDRTFFTVDVAFQIGRSQILDRIIRRRRTDLSNESISSQAGRYQYKRRLTNINASTIPLVNIVDPNGEHLEVGEGANSGGCQ